MEGIQVTNGTDVGQTAIKDMNFTSQALSLKNVIYGSGSLTPSSYTNPSTSDVYQQAKIVIPHNLGYAPTVFVYFRPGNINTDSLNYPWQGDTNNTQAWGFADNYICTTVVDTINLTLQFRHCKLGVNVDYRYFILVEPTT